MTLLRLCVAACLVVSAFSSPLVSGQAQRTATTKTQAKVVYSCPMHPDVKSSKKGRCPKCGMDLRPVKTEVAPAPPDSVSTDPVAVPKPETATTSSFNSGKIPHTRVLDQNGKERDFYTDLIKGKSVAINFLFTTCTAICPPLASTFRRVQQEAHTRGVDVQLISITVDPTVDTPERLLEFAKKFKAEPGWTFVTGDKADIDSLLQALGAAVANKNDHTPMILVGNAVSDRWTRTYGLSSPSTILNLIEASSQK
jgi:cytochrome oxidase Cu insertion factor (SCO1/SenC/PrrC family)